jgi:hypothetical protein
MKLKMLLGLSLGLISLSAAAADQVAKEETTPPPAEGALSADQIPPISHLGTNPAPTTTPPPTPSTPPPLAQSPTG